MEPDGVLKTVTSHANRYYLSTIKRCDADIRELVRNLFNPAIANKLLNILNPYREADSEAWISAYEAEAATYPEHRSLRRFIREKHTDKIVGDISLVKQETEGFLVVGMLARRGILGAGDYVVGVRGVIETCTKRWNRKCRR
jgi:RimJ/RimL family protein N-acetyltransferase